jgi:hypothetical protein
MTGAAPLRLFLAAIALTVSAAAASAVSDQVKFSCRDDYYTHCPSHAVGSANLKRCMKSAGPKLSSQCIKALVASGEISHAEVKEIARRLKHN